MDVTFPLGSHRNDKKCFDIKILDDIEIEGPECFTLFAHILPTKSCANFGGDLSSRSGTIDVVIIDDDDNSQGKIFQTWCLVYPLPNSLS